MGKAKPIHHTGLKRPGAETTLKAILLLFSSFGAALATFALQLIFSRLLDSDSFGKIAFANSITIIIGTFACSGICGLLLRRSSITPESHIENLEIGLKGITIVCVIAYILCSTILTANEIGIAYSAILSISIFSLSAQTLLTVQGQIKNSPIQIAASQVSLPALRATASTVLFTITPSFSAAVYLTGIVSALSTILYRYGLNKSRPHKRARIDLAKTKEFLSSSFKYSLNGSINIAQLQLSTAIMGTLHGLTYAGYMAICNTILTAIYIAPNTIFSTYLQKRYHTLRPDEQFTPLKHAALSFTAGVLIAIPLYFFAQSIINLLFGTQYQEAANIFKVMCLAIPIRFLITSIGAAILSESVVKYKILAAGLGLIIQVFLFISLSSMGSTGIGISVIVSEIIVATLYLTIYMKPLTK